jgi:hypothetical protein
MILKKYINNISIWILEDKFFQISNVSVANKLDCKNLLIDKLAIV